MTTATATTYQLTTRGAVPTTVSHEFTDSDDANDLTADVQAFIDSVADGVVSYNGTPYPSVIDFGGARLHCEKPLRLYNRNWLRIFNGTVYALAKGVYTLQDGFTPIYQNPDGSWYFINSNGKKVSVGNPQSYRRHWDLYRTANVTLDNIRVESVNTKDQQDKPGYPQYLGNFCFEHAFEIDACSNTLITECSSMSTFGDAVNIGTDNGSDPRVTDTVITNCDFQRTGRQGVSITRADNTVVTDTNILRSARAGVDMEPETTAATVIGVTLARLVIDSGNDPVAAAGQGEVSNVDISDITVLNVGAAPVVVSRPDTTVQNHDWSISGIDTTADHRWSSDRYAFEIIRCDNISLRGNTVFLQPDINHGGSHKLSNQGNCVLLNFCGGTIEVVDNEFQNGNQNSGMDITNVATDATVDTSGNTFPVVAK